MPVTDQEKSLRNWYFFCCVCCGVFAFWPIETPFGKVMLGSRLLADRVGEIRVLEDELVQLRAARAPSCGSR
jgi:hypothetical protein